MKKIVFTLAAIMTIGASLAQAEGAGRALEPQNVECRITLRTGEQTVLSVRRISPFVVKKQIGQTELSLKYSSGQVTVAAIEPNDAQVITGFISGHGYVQGHNGGLTATCYLN